MTFLVHRLAGHRTAVEHGPVFSMGHPPKACLPEGGVNAGVSQTKGTYVCLVISSPAWAEDGTGNYSRIAFNPTVDKFSRLQFSDAFANTTATGLQALYGPNVAIHVESMGVASYQKLYQAEDVLGRTFPIHTAIINVDKGVVTGITFDSGCVLCDNSERCIENTFDYTGAPYGGVGATSDCYKEYEECVDDPKACELQLYVSWTGTDARGNYLTSSSRRFSLFSAYSVESYLNGLKKGIMGIQMQNADG